MALVRFEKKTVSYFERTITVKMCAKSLTKQQPIYQKKKNEKNKTENIQHEMISNLMLRLYLITPNHAVV